MRPIVKVWCLPDLTQEQLQALHRDIVATVAETGKIGVRGPEDMLCLFPGDMMNHGLGSEVLIEVSGLELTGRKQDSLRKLAQGLVDTVVRRVPKVMHIQCHVTPTEVSRVYSVVRKT